MNEDTRPESDPQLSAAAQAEWSGIVDQVLRGIAHSLNNRASAISAVLELARDPSDDTGAATAILATELERVQELVAVARLVGAPPPAAEAFLAADCIAEAGRVLAMHAEIRNVEVDVDADSMALLRVPRWMFVRALVALLVAAATERAPNRLSVSVTAEGEGEWIVTRIAPRPGSRELSRYATELATAMGGALLSDGYGLRVPSLTEIRRREGR